MDLLTVFCNQKFKDYYLSDETHFVYQLFSKNIFEKLQQKGLYLSLENLEAVYQELGGDQYFYNEYVSKYDIENRNWRMSRLLNWTFVLSILLLIGLTSIFGIWSMLRFFTNPYYNYTRDIFFIKDISYTSLFFLNSIFRLLLLIIGTAFYMMKNKSYSKDFNILFLVLVGVLTLPFGLLILYYAYKLYQFNKSNLASGFMRKVITFTVVGVLGFASLTGFRMTFRQHDAYEYGLKGSDMYEIIYTCPDDLEDVYCDGMIWMRYNDKSESAFELELRYAAFDFEDTGMDLTKPVAIDVYINDLHYTTDDFQNVSTNIGSMNFNDLLLFEHNSMISNDQFNPETIELRYIISYTDSSGNEITREIIIDPITDIDEFRFNLV